MVRSLRLRKHAPLGGFFAALLSVAVACSSDGGRNDPSGNTSTTGEGANTAGTTAQTAGTTNSPDSSGASGDAETDQTGQEGTTESASGGNDNTKGESPTDGEGSGDSESGSGGSSPAAGDDARPSEGCQETTLPQSGKRSLEIGSSTREFIIQIPDSYDPLYPYPLIFGFHGAKYDAEWVALGEEPLTGPYFGIADEAQGAAIFVAPQAAGTWSAGDIDFVQAMVASIKETACVDESRLFATGFSMGGIMTARLGCALADVFRAVAPMSASLPTECNGDFPPLAYLGTHGTSDNTITLTQGKLVRDSYVARNECDNSVGTLDENGCANYADCIPTSPVRWCTFDGQHVPYPQAGVEIWKFFSQF